MDDEDLKILKILIYIIIFLLFGIVIITCRRVPDDFLMTVTGPVKASGKGYVLEHEHILVDFIGADSTGYSRWDREKVIEKVLPSILSAKDKGVKMMFESTPAFLGRDPLLLKDLSATSGIVFVTNTGYYGARNNLFLPGSFYSLEATQLAELWTNEYQNGIEDTGIKPGFIKIGVNPDDSLSPDHTKLIKAAAITHLKTGMVIASHTGPDSPALQQISLLKEMGVSPSAFIWIHAQGGTIEGNLQAARDGAWISLDNVHFLPDIKPGDTGSPDWYCSRLSELKKNGVLDKILISHDSGWYDPAKPDGGTINGYTAIFDHLIPALKNQGFTDDEINQLLVLNPREAFKIKIRRL